MKRPYRFFVVLAVLVLLAAGCQTAQEQATPTPIPTPIVAESQTYTVQRGMVQRIQEFNARISPVVEVELFFEQNGYVDQIFVDRNDFVEEGQILAQLQQEATVNQLAQAQVNLERAQSTLEQAVQANERQVAESAVNLEIKKLRLEAFRNQTPDAVDEIVDDTKVASERQIAESAASLETKRLKLQEFKMQNPQLDVTIAAKRLEEAAARRDVAQSAYDAVSWKPGVEATNAARNLQLQTIAYEIAQVNYEQAKAKAETYKIDLQIMEKDYELAQLKHSLLENSASEDVIEASEKAQKQVDDYELELGIMEKEYELAELRHSYLEAGVDPNLAKAVQQAELNVEKLEGDVNKGRIISPVEGVVTSLALTEGRQVEAFRKVAVVANMDELELASQLSDAEMQDLEVGMQVTVTLGAYPGRELVGFISEMPYPYASGGSTAKLDQADQFTHIQLQDPEIELRMGDVAKISVLLEQADNTLWLPPAAIRNFEGRNFVVVEQQGRQRRIDIKVGIIGEDRMEVLEGLSEGDIVLGQ